MTNGTRLTDEEIDRLSGRELDEAVALAMGFVWSESEGWLNVPDSWAGDALGFRVRRTEDNERHIPGACLPKWHDNLGAAMGLLLGAQLYVQVSIGQSAVVVYQNFKARNPISGGPKKDAATVICRAYLKLKNRE